MAERSLNMAWFDPRHNVVLRLYAFLLLLFVGGAVMYVWCELFVPRWYSGPLRNRYGLLISNSDYNVLGLPDQAIET